METILLFSQSQKNFWEFLPTVHEAIQQLLNDWVEVTQLKLLTPSACRERNFVSSSWMAAIERDRMIQRLLPLALWTCGRSSWCEHFCYRNEKMLVGCE